MLGDPDAWLEKRWRRLALATVLFRLGGVDVEAVAVQARRGDGTAVRTLVGLLAAEASCVDGLPCSPAAALMACGPAAADALVDLAEDREPLDAARALAALVLGALDRRAGAPPRPLGTTPWCRRSYELGRREGLPPGPGVVVHALAGAHDAGARMARALSSRSPFALPTGLVLELLDGGVAPARVAALMEASLGAGALASRLRWRDQPVVGARTRRGARPPTWIERRDVSARRAEEEHNAAARIAGALHAWARATAAPADLELARRCAEALLGLGAPSFDLADAVAGVLERALELPSALARAYLELVLDERDCVWPRPADADASGRPAAREWFGERETAVLGPARALLRLTADPDVVRRALVLGACAELARCGWRDPATCAWLVAVLDRLETIEPWRVRELLVAVRACGEDDARRALQPLIDAVLAAPDQHRGWLLADVLDAIGQDDAPTRAVLPLAAAHVPALVAALAEGDHMACCTALLPAAIEAERTAPQTASDLLAALLSELRALRPPGSQTPGEWAVQVAGELAAGLAADAPARARAAFRALALHQPDASTSSMRDGARLARRFPTVRRALAELVAEHPRRAVAVLVRLGLTTRLGDDVLTPIAALEETLAAPPRARDAAGWSGVLAAWPELAGAMEAYLALERACGPEPAPPPGVRELVEQPARLARELGHIEGILAVQPERRDLRLRAESLRARLADRARVLAAGRDEARARLERLAGLARLALIERAVADCYRARLRTLVGPVAPDLVLDDDLLNAVLLTGEVSRNRRLLRRLLVSAVRGTDAHPAGDRGWRERHPANAAYLKRLAGQGADVGVWLSRSPRSFPFAPAKGGRVRLWLEQDPLRILQMGNYFDTCLSFGGVNAFATVANAAELNKRVVYAADGAGRVLGRKLIGLTAEGKLVGFRTYTVLSRQQGGGELRGLFAHYLRDFARRCGLDLADAGEVPRLFAEAWYDDGVVPWGGEDAGQDPPLLTEDNAARPSKVAAS